MTTQTARQATDRWREFARSAWRAQQRSLEFLVLASTGRRSRDFARHGLSAPRTSARSALHASLDELMLIYFETDRPRPSSQDFTQVVADIEALAGHHRRLGVDDDPRLFHEAPPVPLEAEIEPRTFAGIDAEWLTFPSGWEPHEEAPARDRWLESSDNETVHAGVLRHDDRPRPWLLLVHPLEMGRPDLDARYFRAETLHRELGVNIVMPVLPQHGPRGHGRQARRGSFLDLDIVTNLYGLAQSVWDVRRTLAWVRTQEPTAVGIHGFSLGGFVSSMLVCLEPDLDAAVICSPAVDFVSLFSAHLDDLVDPDEFQAVFDFASRVYTPVDPLQLQPLLPPDRMMLGGAVADRLVDPIDQLLPLWRHFGQPELRWFETSHVGYMLSSEPTEVLMEAFATRGVVSD